MSTPTGKPRTEGSGSDQRFRRSHRITDAEGYRAVFRRATASRDRYFTVLYRKGAGNGPRLGLAIAKKNCRQATARNRLKRLIRESFRQHKHLVNGLDIVVINTRAAAAADNSQIATSLAGHWQRCADRKG